MRSKAANGPFAQHASGLRDKKVGKSNAMALADALSVLSSQVQRCGLFSRGSIE